MKIKTFAATYLLLLFVLFACLSIVSVYLNNSQTNMLRRQSERDYNRISATLARDIAVSYGRSANMPGEEFSGTVEALALGYARYYRRHGIDIELIYYYPTQNESELSLNNEIAFVQRDQEHFVHISGVLPEPFHFYRLNFYSDVTESIINMRNIQRILLIFFIAFSAIAAFALYFILLRIFKPLDIVAKTSRKIADEHFHERIRIKGNNELAKVAEDFNRMAEKIESQIRLLEEESAGKQRFIDNFAHEVRTPLTSIYGNAEYMQKAVLDDGDLIKLSQSIMDKAGQITDIANSLLRLATLRNYSPAITDISVKQLFEEIALLLYKPMNEHGVRLVYKSDVDILPGQEDLIKSLLLNLCLNGLKACSPESGIVSLKAEMQNGNVVLSVADNGKGIPAKSLEKVTEPFYRADKVRNRHHGGSAGRSGAGLGLTLCKQIADVHGAEMIIRSSVGVGTIVKIIFTTS